MTAKEAKKITAERQAEVSAAQAVIDKNKRVEVERTLEMEIQSEIKYWNSCIRSAAKDGKDWVETNVPKNDKVYKVVKEYFEDQGYRVSQYSTDEGYCIGDVLHTSVSW
jgi:hypothetical protein